MQQTTAVRRPVWPLRALAVLLLTGFGLWQAWHCSGGMAASAVAGMPAMSAATSHAGHVDMETDSAGPPAPGHEMPVGMAGLCINVLASAAAAFVLWASPVRLLAMLRRLLAVVVRPVPLIRPRWSLTQLCVSRT